jgi:hypothetical protein
LKNIHFYKFLVEAGDETALCLPDGKGRGCEKRDVIAFYNLIVTIPHYRNKAFICDLKGG